MTVKIEYKQPIGKVEIQEKGKDLKVTEIKVGEAIFVDKPMANVGMKVGMTKNLGNYESVRVDISLYMPCLTDDVSISETFDLIENWCDLKMQGIVKEYEDSK